MSSTPETAAPTDPPETPGTGVADDPADATAGASGSAPERLPDPVLIAAHEVARAALVEVTPEATVGEPAGYVLEDEGVVSLRFATLLPGYPGWWWTVSVARVEDAEPTVLEVELLPGDGALLAPEWVPWAVRLADYQAAQAATADEIVDLDLDLDLDADSADDEAGDLFDDDLEDGADADPTPVLHSGDVDGVDIDELDQDDAGDLFDDDPLDEGDDAGDDDGADDLVDPGADRA